MKKIASGAIAVLMAGSLLTATATPSSAAPFPLWPLGIGIAAGTIGFLIGSGMADEFDMPHYRAHFGLNWHTHMARCETRYRSYKWQFDSFVGNDGDWHRCRL